MYGNSEVVDEYEKRIKDLKKEFRNLVKQAEAAAELISSSSKIDWDDRVLPPLKDALKKSKKILK